MQSKWEYFRYSQQSPSLSHFLALLSSLTPREPNKFKEGTSDAAICDNCNQCVVAVDTVRIQCLNDNLVNTS